MNFQRIKSDINGNPRHVVHFTDLEPPKQQDTLRRRFTLPERYARTIKAANKLGGRKYSTRAYGGGIVFQAYECELPRLVELVRALLEKKQ